MMQNESQLHGEDKKNKNKQKNYQTFPYPFHRLNLIVLKQLSPVLRGKGWT